MTEKGRIASGQSTETHQRDVVTFCALLARIMDRCLREQDPRIMALINARTTVTVQEREVSDAA